MNEKIALLKNIPMSVIENVACGRHISEIIQFLETSGLHYLAERLSGERKVDILKLFPNGNGDIWEIKDKQKYFPVGSAEFIANNKFIEVGSEEFFTKMSEVYIHNICSCEWHNNLKFKLELLKYAEVFIFVRYEPKCYGHSAKEDFLRMEESLSKGFSEISMKEKVEYMKDKFKKSNENFPDWALRRLHIIPSVFCSNNVMEENGLSYGTEKLKLKRSFR